jgi:pimeloyl-ACP methyl ester carboxylesterase
VTAPQPFAGPALFLRGDRSEYVLAADEPLIHALFPRAEIRTVAQAGHWLHADAPEEFVRLVREFLSGEGCDNCPKPEP